MSGFAKSEIATLLKGLTRSMHGIFSRADYEAVMDWATAARLDADLLELVLAGYLDPCVGEDGALTFVRTEKGLASPKAQQLERMGS